MLTQIQKKLRYKLLKTAYNNKCTHIPSALSMVDYFYYIDKLINYKTDALIIGKPYGQLAYYTVWNINNYKPITSNNKYVLWADSTIGNCLGVAYGIALSKKYDNVFINIGDATLQEGTILEAMQCIGKSKYKKSNIILCVDYNQMQCIGKNYLDINTTYNICTAFGWLTLIINGHSTNDLKQLNIKKILKNNITTNICLLFNTKKGYGIDFMENNPIEWHYKKMNILEYKKSLKILCDI